MRELVEWLRGGRPSGARGGSAQFQLVHIHPFVDGNGRTSVALDAVPHRAGYDFKRLFTLSEFYDRDRSAFYRAIQSVREQGWTSRLARVLRRRAGHAVGGGEGPRDDRHPRRRDRPRPEAERLPIGHAG